MASVALQHDTLVVHAGVASFVPGLGRRCHHVFRSSAMRHKGMQHCTVASAFILLSCEEASMAAA
eukprot:1160321-Pelagomonas_calceolata.AAC.7